MATKIKKILVSQPKPESEKSPYFDIEEKYNVQIVFRQFIKIEPVTAPEFRAQKVDILSHSVIVFTARQAIDHFFRLAKEMRLTIPDTMKYVCTSENIANYLQKYLQYRKRKISFGDGTTNGLLPFLQKLGTEKFLLTLSDVHKQDLIEMMESNNFNYSQAIMYRTVSNEFRPDETFDYDVLIFFSPSGIISLKKSFPNFEQGDIRIGCLGAETAKSIRDAGLRLDFEAPRPDAPSITAALEIYLKEQKKAEKTIKATRS